MSGASPSNQHEQPSPAEGGVPTPVPAVERANRMSAANMLRSLLPLVAICLLAVGWVAFRQDGVDPVREVDPASSIAAAAARAGYPLEAPAGLPADYRPTSARFAGDAGGPVTLEIGYVTPSAEFAGFVTSDDPDTPAVDAVLGGAQPRGTVEIGGRTWTRSTTGRGETALSREVGGVTVLVTGSASDEELATVAAAVRPVGR